MGLFSFKKKDAAAPVENKSAAAPKVDVKEAAPQAASQSKTSEIKTTDCAYDPKRRVFVYATGVVPNLAKGQVMKLEPSEAIKELNYSITSPTEINDEHSGELFIELKYNSTKFGKQPLQVGEVIATSEVVNT